MGVLQNINAGPWEAMEKCGPVGEMVLDGILGKGGGLRKNEAFITSVSMIDFKDRARSANPYEPKKNSEASCGHGTE